MSKYIYIKSNNSRCNNIFIVRNDKILKVNNKIRISDMFSYHFSLSSFFKIYSNGKVKELISWIEISNEKNMNREEHYMTKQINWSIKKILPKLRSLDQETQVYII